MLNSGQEWTLPQKMWEDVFKEWTGMDSASSTRAAGGKALLRNRLYDLPMLWARIE